jgi:hypothetical protein
VPLHTLFQKCVGMGTCDIKLVVHDMCRTFLLEKLYSRRVYVEIHIQ